MDALKEKIQNLPDSSGVYIYKGEHNEILYVGKAKNLKRRVSQYFFKSVRQAKTLALREKICDLNYIVTPSELDALVLENNLIKRHKPPYNILLKDDKTYPYVKIKLKEDYPSVEITRVLKQDGSRYFGPYMLGISATAIMDVLHYAFPIRSCRRDLKHPSDVCLDYHLGRCLGPCNRKCTKEEYRLMLDGVIKFLSGDDKSVADDLTRKMEDASEKEDFELAKEYRDSLKILDVLVRKQVAYLPRNLDADVFGIYGDSLGAVVNILMVRGGKILGSDSIPLTDDSPETFSQFLIQYYDHIPVIATKLIVSCLPEFDSQIVDYLKEKAGKKVEFVLPQMGVLYDILEMSQKNAKEFMDKNAGKIKMHNDMTIGAVLELYNSLNLSRPPYRMECYDISNISGTNKVSSMVVFKSGVKAANHYRKFKIKTVEGSNDFASMRETLTRRIRKIGNSEDISFNEKPDLIVIDGGKGQLSSVADIIPDDIDVISLAKRMEEVFVRGRGTEPYVLDMDSNALKLIQRLRDESHRFAITFHRELRGKAQTKSCLTDIDGVGEKTAKRLMTVYKDINLIASAEIADLEEKGFNKKVAENIFKFFHSMI